MTAGSPTKPVLPHPGKNLLPLVAKDGQKNDLPFFKVKREGRREARPDKSANYFLVDPKLREKIYNH